MILAAGALVDPIDEEGRTPLYEAAQHGRADVIEVLLEHGADIDRPDRSLEANPLVKACTKGHTECVRKLIAAGADLHIWLAGGETPLHKAASWRRPDAVAELLKAGADPWAVSDSGETAKDRTNDLETTALLETAMKK